MRKLSHSREQENLHQQSQQNKITAQAEELLNTEATAQQKLADFQAQLTALELIKSRWCSDFSQQQTLLQQAIEEIQSQSRLASTTSSVELSGRTA